MYFLYFIFLFFINFGKVAFLLANDIETSSVDYAILMDFDTSEILYQKNMDEISAPSSMTKIMTAYVIFELLESGDISIDDKFKVSVRAWRQDGTRMFLEPEWRVSVDDLLKGLLAVSGNDAAIVLAEGSLGSIDNFVERMNKTAKKLGMKNTHFNNPNGLYEKTHYMSVYDLAILSRALLQNYKKYYDKYFSIKSFTYNEITQKNKNILLNEYNGTDGIKTGYTEQGKYSMSASAEKCDKRLIVVVNGAKNEKERANVVKNLFNYGFSNYKCLNLFKNGDIVGEVEVMFGENNQKAKAYVKNNVVYPVKIGNIENIGVNILYDKYISAPIKKDDVIGKLRIIDKDIIIEYDLYSKDDIQEISKWNKIKTLLLYNFNKLIYFWKK